VAIAQDVLARAVVYARERGGAWTTIAEALDTTAEQARDQYTATADRWEDALDRRWEHSGRFLASQMPDGTTNPDRTAADLDEWCLRHLEESSGARHNARHDGIEDRMVSAILPEHTPVTEMTSLTRSAGVPHPTRHQRHRGRAGCLSDPQDSGTRQAPSQRRRRMSSPDNIMTTCHAQAAARQQRLHQIADLVSEYAEPADRPGNADLTALVFQARLVPGDGHVGPIEPHSTTSTTVTPRFRRMTSA
jgi:hypothetical protein